MLPAAGILLLALVQAAIALRFLRRRLGAGCDPLLRSPYARLLGRIPNAALGLAWALALAAGAATSLLTGAFPLHRACLAAAWAGAVVAVYLTWALLFRLRRPCPL